MSTPTSQSNYVNKREFARVDAYLPLEVRPVPAGTPKEQLKACYLGNQAMPTFHTLPELDDERLTEWFRVLNAKLDAVLSAVTAKQAGVEGMPTVWVNISGNGMRFSSKIAYKLKDHLELRMHLPVSPPIGLCLYAEVVQVGQHEGETMVGVNFTEMSEDIQGEILRFVLLSQRGSRRRELE